ncbi:type II toxin-antitoxin system HicA family toxin [Dictyobacter formicarum]|uniref:Addiction module toxin, HicA family protein n=1 Tax=Dictyobacter formicarum TaxID=2778368 RepID=A0ABQ3VQQ4_9CHLR|nr:type II toxin-antitoxin system HicA family toxin [Dictyobacter formicarum]GHO88039.1 hypothetical protein KSZ_60450 [Dictyobacter formicarum]
MKIRELKAILRRRGYHVRRGKGSHTVWTHPAHPEKPIILNGSDNDDAHPYQVATVYPRHTRPCRAFS